MMFPRREVSPFVGALTIKSAFAGEMRVLNLPRERCESWHLKQADENCRRPRRRCRFGAYRDVLSAAYPAKRTDARGKIAAGNGTAKGN